MSGSSEEEDEATVRVVKELKEATRNLSKNSNNVEALLQGLKRLQSQELGHIKRSRDPKLRRKLLSLYNLVSQLEPQVQQARKLANRKGIRYYLSRAKGKVLGNDISDVAHLMESELQSWLDLHKMDHLRQILQDEKHGEGEKIEALQAFQARLQSGYNLELQNVIMSTKVLDCVRALLSSDAKVSVSLKKEAAFTIAALVHFNKDVFVSEVLLTGVVESLLDMLECHVYDVCVCAVVVFASLIVAGKGAVVDEIYARDGIPRIVSLLDSDCPELRMAAMDCVFEIAYYGRLGAVEAILEADVVKKLAILQLSDSGGQLKDLPQDSSNSVDREYSEVGSFNKENSEVGSCNRENSEVGSCNREICHQNSSEVCQDDQSDSSNSTINWPNRQHQLNKVPSDSSSQNSESPNSRDDHHRRIEEYWETHPFANVVAKFAMQLAMGQGLRNREKRALKLKIVRLVKEAIPSDAQAATILAEVLWGL